MDRAWGNALEQGARAMRGMRPARPLPSAAAIILLLLLSGLLTTAALQGAQAAKPQQAPGATLTYVSDVRIRGGAETHIVLRMSRRLVPRVFTLPTPYRLIVDLPNGRFRLPATKPISARHNQRHLVKDYRFGLLTPLTSRMIFDIASPFTVKAIRIVNLANGACDVVFEMVRVPRSAYRRQGREPARANRAALRRPHYPNRPGAKRRVPVIVIDPGHGGPDPGAVGAANVYEKTIALAVSRVLRQRLAARRRYKVIMTRTRDIFVSLEDRVALSKTVGADLFLSIHADATERQTPGVRGASIYTLSHRASNAAARLFAQKENAADVLAGFPIANTASAGAVENILIDLLKRETEAFSYRAREALIASMRGTVKLARDPRRAAAFKVLKQTRTPSVLIELGYISNPHDHREMRTERWQRAAAEAIARAVDAFFLRTGSIIR
ncbi:MAG: N-acetylmuramoyl-L-alanine amidase [Hyphomicrobiaceae bacterium]|nr:N-acetylmuramoyl-L-alanine amidase [Hyphomicrobiaceae bacterium]